MASRKTKTKTTGWSKENSQQLSSDEGEIEMEIEEIDHKLSSDEDEYNVESFQGVEKKGKKEKVLKKKVKMKKVKVALSNSQVTELSRKFDYFFLIFCCLFFYQHNTSNSK